SPFSSYLLLQNLLTVEGISLELDQKLVLIEKSNGDIRSLLNLVQSKLQGDYESLQNNSKVLSVEDCVNLFFSTETVSQLKRVLIQSDILYLSPKFGSTPEERMRDIVYALFSSIVANEKKISLVDIAKVLDALSQFDLYVNKIYKNREWHLLRYANDMLISKLFDITRGLPIKYNQYNIPFPLIGSIFIRGQSTRMVGKLLSKIFHTNSSDFGMFYFLPLLTILKGIHTILFFNTAEDAKLNEIILKE